MGVSKHSSYISTKFEVFSLPQDFQFSTTISPALFLVAQNTSLRSISEETELSSGVLNYPRLYFTVADLDTHSLPVWSSRFSPKGSWNGDTAFHKAKPSLPLPSVVSLQLPIFLSVSTAVDNISPTCPISFSSLDYVPRKASPWQRLHHWIHHCSNQ